MTIYEEMVKLGVEIDNHSSDLYVPANPETRAILEKRENWTSVSIFIHQVHNKQWYDVPFAFDPFWEKKMAIMGN
jgi:hypothetical protein